MPIYFHQILIFVVGFIASAINAIAFGGSLVSFPTLIWLVRQFAQPKPEQAPPNNPVWPLWWAPIAFIHTRRAGGLLILGLLGWAIYVAVR